MNWIKNLILVVNNETEKKDHDHTKYINTQEFDKLTS